MLHFGNRYDRPRHRAESRRKNTAIAPLLVVLLFFAPTLVHATVLHVPSMFPDIQLAIDVAVDGDEIHVEPGVYLETLTFGGKAIVVRSLAGPEVTTIDASGAGPVIRFVDNETEESVVEGFTIQGGTGEELGGIYRGGGIFIVDASPRIMGCFIRGNTASDGGGIYASGVGSTPLFHQCRIEFNLATFTGGGGCFEAAAPEFVSCEFFENDALSGGAAWCHFGAPTFRSCLITYNDATLVGGALALVSTDAFVNESQFLWNEAQNGGAVLIDDSTLVSQRSSYYQNLAQAQGGAFRIQGATDVTLERCSMAHNYAIQLGGALFVAEADSVVVHNSILYWNNGGGPQIEVAGSTLPDVTYCTIQLGYAGVGNIALAPLFPLQGTSGDLSLTEFSPCINQGDPASLPDPDGTTADMGAFYYESVVTDFIRGDCNSDSFVNVGDAIFGLLSLFPDDGQATTCRDACDSNDDGLFNVADVIYGLQALFTVGAAAPPMPYPDCGVDPSDVDTLDCAEGACVF